MARLVTTPLLILIYKELYLSANQASSAGVIIQDEMVAIESSSFLDRARF
jgi:hypothetical protein